MSSRAKWAALLVVVACGGAAAENKTTPAPTASAAPSSAPPPASASVAIAAPAPPTVVITPMRFVTSLEGRGIVGRGNFGFQRLELDADGKMTRDADSWGAIKKDSVVVPPAIVILVAPDGTLTDRGGKHEQYAKLVADGVRGRDGSAITIADDGTVTETLPGGETMPLHGKFDAIPTHGKPAAALMLMTTGPATLLWSKTKLP